MLNLITLQGRLTKDPELRYTQNNVPVATFTVACNRRQEGVDFIDCVAWRQTGEFVNKWFKKGSMILLTGSLQSRKWQDKQGNNRTSWEVIVDNVNFCESKKQESPFEELEDDGDLPF